MGRKVHPVGFRLGINQPWGGRWFAEGSTYRQQLHQDLAIRNLLMGKLSKGGAAANEKVRELRKELPDAIRDGKAGVSHIDVERTPGKIAHCHSYRQARYFDRAQGRRREEDPRRAGSLGWQEDRIGYQRNLLPDLDAKLVAKNIADQLERRIAYRRAMKRAIQQAMKQGAEGIKILVGGRLGGAEMSVMSGCAKDAFLCRPCVPIWILPLTKR
jgi:small subunit ribosomal protein S3